MEELHLHPQILHFEKCRGAHERGEVIENIHEGYVYKPCISTFMSACVSLQSKSKIKQVSTNEQCPFLDYQLGVFDLSKCSKFDNIDNMLEKCQTIYSYLNVIHDFLDCHIDEMEILYEGEISFLKELNLKSIVLELLNRHVKIRKISKENRTHDSYLCFSLFSSLIEKIMQMILVEVCGTDYEHPPTFSDLLTDEKIEELFDRNFLNFVRLTLAHPGGLNLRNLLWHGFISQSEDFDDRYSSITFLILMTILKSQKSLENRIISQEKVRRWKSGHSDRITTRIHSFERYCYPHGEEKSRKMNIEEIESLCHHSYFIPPDREKLITSCFRELLGDHENGHVYFSYLIIPQLEHFLRRVYICSNKLDPDLLLAKSREFFTIIDNILAYEIRTSKEEEEEEEEGEKVVVKNTKKEVVFDAKNNLLWREIGIRNHHQCLDLFYLSEGLRIRDIIAHSEIHPLKIPRIVSETIYRLSISLISHFDIRRKKVKMDRSLAHSVTSFPIFHPKTCFFEKLEEIGGYFRNSYLKKMDFHEDVSVLLKNTKEVFGFECIWTRKGFFYRKVKEPVTTTSQSTSHNQSNQDNQKKNKKQKKKNVMVEFSLSEVESFLDYQYENILQSSKNRYIVERLCSIRSTTNTTEEGETEKPSQHPVIHYINAIQQEQKGGKKIHNIIEDYDLCFEFRKKIMNNLGIARKILEEELKIMKMLESRYDELYELVKTRKATTSKRKNFGCLTKTKRLFSNFLEIQVTLTLDLLISSFFETPAFCRAEGEEEESEEKTKKMLRKQENFYHKRLFRLMSVVNRCRLDGGNGKLGKIIKELVFDQFDILKWKR